MLCLLCRYGVILYYLSSVYCRLEDRVCACVCVCVLYVCGIPVSFHVQLFLSALNLFSHITMFWRSCAVFWIICILNILAKCLLLVRAWVCFYACVWCVYI